MAPHPIEFYCSCNKHLVLTIESPYIHFLFTLLLYYFSNATLDNHLESIERLLSIKQDSGVIDIFVIISLQILSKTLALLYQ